MLTSKLQVVLAVVLVMGIVATGATVFTCRTAAQDNKPPMAAEKQENKPSLAAEKQAENQTRPIPSRGMMSILVLHLTPAASRLSQTYSPSKRPAQVSRSFAHRIRSGEE